MKRTIAYILTLALTASLIACGSGGSQSGETTEPSSDGTSTAPVSESDPYAELRGLGSTLQKMFITQDDSFASTLASIDEKIDADIEKLLDSVK